MDDHFDDATLDLEAASMNQPIPEVCPIYLSLSSLSQAFRNSSV